MSFEMYQIEELNGIKHIHYNGYIWFRGAFETPLNERGEACPWCIEEGTGCYVPVTDGGMYDDVWAAFEDVQQYGEYITDAERHEYMSNWGGEELHMDDVTQDTPCGCYWFELDE